MKQKALVTFAAGLFVLTASYPVIAHETIMTLDTLTKRTPTDHDAIIAEINAQAPELAQFIKDNPTDAHLNLLSTISRSKLPVIVKFYAAWCAPCRKLAPDFVTLAQEFEGKALFIEINIDKFPESRKFNVKYIPTLLYFKDGKLVEASNSLSLPALQEKLKNLTK